MVRITRRDIEKLLGELENYNLFYSIMSFNTTDGIFLLAGRVENGFIVPTRLTLNSETTSGVRGSFLTVMQFKNAGEIYSYIEGMLTILRNIR